MNKKNKNKEDTIKTNSSSSKKLTSNPLSMSNVKKLVNNNTFSSRLLKMSIKKQEPESNRKNSLILMIRPYINKIKVNEVKIDNLKKKIKITDSNESIIKGIVNFEDKKNNKLIEFKVYDDTLNGSFNLNKALLMDSFIGEEISSDEEIIEDSKKMILENLKDTIEFKKIESKIKSS